MMAAFVRQYVTLFILAWLTELSRASIHLPLIRRGGRFVGTSPANLSHLALILAEVEDRYAQTDRVPEKNHLTRKWSSVNSAVDDEHLVGVTGHQGAWYVKLDVGSPPQTLEFDIDMLGPDFYTLMTTSGDGSKYDTFASTSHERGAPVHTICGSSRDLFNFTSSQLQLPLSLPTCTPPKSSSLTLAFSGSVLGLSLPGPLSRIQEAGLIKQLKQHAIISDEIWSATILDSETGVLSLGGTIAKEMEQAKLRADLELKHYGDPAATPEWVRGQVESAIKLSVPDSSPTEMHFKWSSTSGSLGWWTSLVTGVWVNGVKVLKNQPVLFDVQCPFVLAPPEAASRFYASIGGSKRLPAPHDMFFAYPCLSSSDIVLELGGWNFPTMSGETTRIDTLYGPAGGRLSLGKVGNGTGFCVGAVVETAMGIREKWANTGMRGMWVLGEPFFRGMGVVFNIDKRRIGFRTY